MSKCPNAFLKSSITHSSVTLIIFAPIHTCVLVLPLIIIYFSPWALSLLPPLRIHLQQGSFFLFFTMQQCNNAFSQQDNTHRTAFTNPCHVVSAVLSRGAHRVSSEGGAVLQLRWEQLQTTGTCWYCLSWWGQARHAAFTSVRSVSLPPHIHWVALRPLLRGEGGGVAKAIVIWLMRRRQSVSGGHPWSSGI